MEAYRLYKDKILKVTGVVVGISKDFLGNPYVKLRGKLLADVWCHVNEKQINNLVDMRPGQKIIALGHGNGITLTSPQIKNCRVE